MSLYTYGSEIWGSFPAQKLLTQGDNYFSKVCRDLIAEKAHIKLCKYSIKVGKKATNSTVMGELGRYPLFLEVLLNMIKYWVRLSKINTSSTLLSECLLLSEALHKQNKKSWYARFRISAHNLAIEKGRHQNIPLNERICKLCKLEIEDEIHFLLQCPILNSFRTEAMQQISDICKNSASLDKKSKFIWLLSNENIIIIKTVDVINRN